MTLLQEQAAFLGDRSAMEEEHARTLVVRPILPAEYGEWDDGLARSPQECLFLRSAWLDLIGGAFGWRIALFGCYEFDRLVGGLAGRIIERDGGLSLDRLLLVPYNGCWIAEGTARLRHRVEHRRQATLSALAHEMTARFGSVVLDLHPANGDVRPFGWGGWNAAVRYTFINDLTRCDQSGYAPRVRRRARRASAAGMSFDSDVSAGEFLQLWSSSLSRQGLREPVPADAVRRVLDRLPDQPFASEICGARLANGRLVAANVILYDRDMAYYWLAGFDPDEPHHGAANQLGHIETLARAARRAARFDWVGANTQTVAEYKQSFGPALVPYYRVTWSRPERDMAGRRLATPLGQWLRACPILKMSDRSRAERRPNK
jgi:hypothetical protein